MMSQISLYYNPENFENKKLKGYAASEDVRIKEIDIRKDPFTGTQLKQIADSLGISVADLVDTEHDKLNIPDGAETTEEEWAKFLRKQPDALKYPIVERDGKVALIQTPSDIKNL